jgi:hypothetical protein
MGFQPVQRFKSEPVGDDPPFAFVRGELDALAVADPVDPQAMGEGVGQRSLPSAISAPVRS